MVLTLLFLSDSGTAIAHASRAPSLSALASEEHEEFSDSRNSGSISPSVMSNSSRRPSKTESLELPGSFQGTTPLLSRDQWKRLGSFDEDSGSPKSPHRSLFRAFSVAGYSGTSPRVDGFPFLTFPTGQVFTLTTNEFLTSRNLMWYLKRKIDGWQGFLGLMNLVGYPRVIVLRYSCEDVNNRVLGIQYTY
jgi:hypothetical protein